MVYIYSHLNQVIPISCLFLEINKESTSKVFYHFLFSLNPNQSKNFPYNDLTDLFIKLFDERKIKAKLTGICQIQNVDQNDLKEILKDFLVHVNEKKN